MTAEEFKLLPVGHFTHGDVFAYRKLYEEVPDHGSTCEIGCWQGKSLCSVADIILRKQLMVYVIDSFGDNISDGSVFSPETFATFADSLARYGLTSHVSISVGLSQVIADTIADRSLDLVFIDANHEAPFVNEDIKLYAPKVKDGGIISGHDFVHPPVRKAVEAMDTAYYTMPDSSIWVYKV